ncbi:hypothetical protein OUZ56_001844 [Daphnia magna]|uniref:Uncharacterized protein n=1 Tax=Daphnia magna TaxID=35525 RepID=A0ABR0A4A0_9CRUS|nr:hypothetical protein OUZ56_001844 [Daphnia magna]
MSETTVQPYSPNLGRVLVNVLGQSLNDDHIKVIRRTDSPPKNVQPSREMLLSSSINVLTLLTATADDVLQEGVLRGHEAPPSSRHHYLDTVNFRNFGGYTGRPDQQNATMVGVLTKGQNKKKKME